MKRWTAAFAFVLVCFAAAGVSAQGPRRLVPVDEGGSDPSFSAFRQTLRDIVRRRDVVALRGVLSPTIRSGSGSVEGIDDFSDFWNVTAPDTTLWRTIERILAMGGTFATREGVHEFDAPYVWSQWPEDLEPREYVAIVGPRVIARAPGPRLGPVLAVLAYALVRRGPDTTEPKPGSPFLIVLADGRAANVDGGSVWSPVDYRARFRKTPEGWRITELVSGD
jgi:hypothetical protein